MNKSSKLCKENTENILSVNVSTLTQQEILRLIDKRAKEKKRTVIFTPNTQMILGAQASSESARLLNSSDINIPDGTGVVLASKMLGGKIKKRISGIDLADSILSLAQKRGLRVFLLGAEKGVAKKAEKNIKKRYPRLNICGTHHGYFNKDKKNNKAILKKIEASRADILFVCMGSPKQEKWIAENAPRLSSVNLCIGLGGSLDVWAGKAQRAPIVFRYFGIEWLYRTINEPRRIRIFADIPVFLFKVWKSRTDKN